MSTPAEQAAERLAWTMESWKSIEVRDHQIVTDYIHDRTNTMEERYVEAANGMRLFERTFPEHQDDGPHRGASYFDGERCADVKWVGDRQTQVIIKDSFSSEDRSAKTERGLLSYLYLEHKPLPEALRNAEHLGASRHLGRDCDRFLIQDVNWTFSPVDLVYLIDRATGMPLEVRGYASAEDRTQDQTLWSWTARSFVEVADGRFFPMKSVSHGASKTPGGDWAPAFTWEIEVKEIAFDRDYPESMFRWTIEPGANVWDRTTGKHWVEPGGAELKVEPTTTTTTSTSTLAPIQALPPGDRTATLSGVSLGLGLAVLAVSGAMWWRRR